MVVCVKKTLSLAEPSRESGRRGDGAGGILLLDLVRQHGGQDGQTLHVRLSGIVHALRRGLVRVVVARHGGEAGMAVGIVRIIDLVADAPHQNAGVIAIPAHQCFQIVLVPCGTGHRRIHHVHTALACEAYDCGFAVRKFVPGFRPAALCWRRKSAHGHKGGEKEARFPFDGGSALPFCRWGFSKRPQKRSWDRRGRRECAGQAHPSPRWGRRQCACSPPPFPDRRA